MWIFITARLRQWIVLAVAVPLATLLVRLVRTRLEKRSGETRVTRGMARLEQLGQRRSRKR